MMNMVRQGRLRCVLVLMTLVLGFVFHVQPVCADRINIDITQPNFQQISIAVPDFKYMSADQPQLARQMAEALGDDLDYSGVLRAMDPKGFLEDPQTMGMTTGDIKFADWRRLGADYLVRSSYQVQGGALRIEARLFDVLGNRMVFGKVYEGDAKNWKTMVHRLADEILFAITGDRGVFDTKLVYVQAQGKGKELYISDFDGSNPVQLTNNQSINLSPNWSTDGTEVAYVSYKEGAARVYSINVYSGAQRLVSGQKGLNIAPAWRPGTSQLAVTLSASGNPDIYLLSSSGDVVQKLVQSWGINVSATWSPDGRRLAYVSNEAGSPQIYVLDVGSGQKRRVSFSGKYNTSPSWSPKGDWIAYSSQTGGRHNICMVRPDGGDVRQLTNGEGDNESPTWSPDGRMIAFSSTRQGGASIWALLTNGTGLRRITRGGGQEMPDWSPRMK